MDKAFKGIALICLAIISFVSSAALGCLLTILEKEQK
jgi:hypothetical protein